MPHRSKRKYEQKTNWGRYIAVAVVVVLAAAAIGYYAYRTAQPSGTTTTSSSSTAACTTMTTANVTGGVLACVSTSKGSFEIELFGAQTPKTVANFVSLVKSGFYDNLVWHRIVDTPAPFVIQTGDPNTKNGGGDRSTWGTGTSSQTVPLEIVSSLHNNRGFLGMAKPANGNGSSQWYINLSNNSNLDGGYTVFGQVVGGMNVVDAIAQVPVNSQSQPIDATQAMLISITIISGA